MRLWFSEVETLMKVNVNINIGSIFLEINLRWATVDVGGRQFVPRNRACPVIFDIS